MDIEERLRLLHRIVEGGDYSTDYLPLLKDLMDDEEAEVRQLAITYLWNYPEREMIEVLLDKAENDPDEGVRCRAIVALGSYIFDGMIVGHDLDWDELTEGLLDEELPRESFLQVKQFLLDLYRNQERTLDERRFAVEALSFLTSPEVFDVIEDAYAHPNRDMKMSAIFAMGRNGDVQWHDAILDELHSPVRELQLEAIRAAGEAQLEGSGKTLQRMTYSDDRDVKLEAIWALGQSGWEGAFDRLDDLASFGEDEEVQEMAEVALEEWITVRGVLAEYYEDDDWDESEEDDDEDGWDG
jgi:HEAT repeat protein